MITAIVAAIQARVPVDASKIRVYELDDKFIAFIDASECDAFAYMRLSHPRSQAALKSMVNRAFGVDLDVVVSVGALEQRVEDFVSSVLEKKFPGLFGIVTVSVNPDSKVDFVLASSGCVAVSPQIAREVHVLCEQILAPLDYRVSSVSVVDAMGGEPSLSLLLRLIKINQPVNESELAKLVVSAGFEAPSLRWLRSRLERLKKSRLIWHATKTRVTGKVAYSLTAAGLAALPSQLGRRSSDIQRALALAKREW